MYDLSDAGDHSHNDHSTTIALSLIAGFVLMLLIDNLGGAGHGHSHGGGEYRPVSDNSSEISIPERGGSGSTITLGLIVHAAADGIALGAASATERSDLQFIVFLAIMLHKAPAAFGLTSVLLREHVSHDRVRKNLLIFSLSAPVGAIVTICGFAMLGGSEESATWGGPAIAMLFSAGTFLYGDSARSSRGHWA